MDMFKNFMGEEVDLDDLESFPERWREMKPFKLWQECKSELGNSLFYMDYLHNDVDWGEQKRRVQRLCKECAAMFHIKGIREDGIETYLVHYEMMKHDLLKLRYRIADEIENQC